MFFLVDVVVVVIGSGDVDDQGHQATRERRLGQPLSRREMQVFVAESVRRRHGQGHGCAWSDYSQGHVQGVHSSAEEEDIPRE